VFSNSGMVKQEFSGVPGTFYSPGAEVSGRNRKREVRNENVTRYRCGNPWCAVLTGLSTVVILF
jgi:hypothetical protein